MLEKEVEQERLKCKSLEEVSKALLMDCNDFQAELQRLKQRLKELEWNVVGMKNEKEKEVKKRRWSGGMVKEGGSVIETVNRFHTLSDHVTEFPPLPKASVVSSRNVKSVEKKNRKGRVLVSSSSQGRSCSDILQNKLGDNFEVCGVKPNARLTDVVEGADRLVNDFDENDCLIVIA